MKGRSNQLLVFVALTVITYGLISRTQAARDVVFPQ